MTIWDKIGSPLAAEILEFIYMAVRGSGLKTAAAAQLIRAVLPLECACLNSTQEVLNANCGCLSGRAGVLDGFLWERSVGVSCWRLGCSPAKLSHIIGGLFTHLYTGASVGPHGAWVVWKNAYTKYYCRRKHGAHTQDILRAVGRH